MMKLKQMLVLYVVLSFLLSACGSSETTTPASTTTPVLAAEVPTTASTATMPANTATPAAEAAATPAAVEATTAPTEAAQASTNCEAGSRLFQHTLLTGQPLCIPEAPKRVVALDMAALEILLMTGQKPVATADWILQELPLLLPQYAETLKPLDGLGYPAELEKVASLQPDLILATEDSIDVKLASAIAPVIIADQAIYEDWKNGMQFWSEVLNVPDLYTEMEANYKTRVSELQAALGERKNLKISLISTSTYGISLWMPDSPPGAILNDVGLSRPESQSQVGEASIAQYGEKQYIQISMERLDLVDADAIFYFTYAATDPKVAADENAHIKKFQQEPVWLALNAVKANQAFFVPGYWWRSQTYLLANLVIDDLFTHLTDTKATTPVLARQ